MYMMFQEAKRWYFQNHHIYAKLITTHLIGSLRFLKKLDFYEFVGVIVPGVVLLIGIGILWPGLPLSTYLLPTTVGAALIHLVGAYATGHLLQGLGNMFEYCYWSLWGGMPTDWPISKPQRVVRPNVLRDVINLTGYSKTVNDLETWRKLFSAGRAKIYMSGAADRAHVFNGNYGMFRGLTVTWIVLASVAWTSDIDKVIVYPVLAVLLALSLYRMHRFALYYAKELYDAIFNLSNDQNHKSTG